MLVGENDMTKSTSFRLSEEGLERLSTLAERMNKSQTAVIEFMIAQRFSVSDPQANAIRREKIWEGFSYTNDIPATPINRKIFIAGFNRGWIDFQIRHGENDFIIPAPE
jgi:hypothetical protein